jgi:hypothetical protein
MRFDDDLQFLHCLVVALESVRRGVDGMWQVSPVFASITHHADTIGRLQSFELGLEKVLPDLVRFGRMRAKRAYGSHADTITKPNYANRLRRSSDTTGLSQLETIEELFSLEPSSGGLVFSVFNPIDLHKRFRPGYVPCLVSGSVLVSNQSVSLNAFFRSQSIVEFGLYDLLFLRELQHQLAAKFMERDRSLKLKVGPLNLFLARAIIQRRLARRTKHISAGKSRYTHIPRDIGLEKWLEVISSFTNDYSLEGTDYFIRSS